MKDFLESFVNLHKDRWCEIFPKQFDLIICYLWSISWGFCSTEILENSWYVTFIPPTLTRILWNTYCLPGLVRGAGRPKMLLSKYLRSFSHEGTLLLPFIWIMFTCLGPLGAACHFPSCSLKRSTIPWGPCWYAPNSTLICTLPEICSQGWESCRDNLGLVTAVDWNVFSNSFIETLTPTCLCLEKGSLKK